MPEFSLDAGKLTKRISIYAAPTGENEINEATTAGTLIKSAWAELNPSGSASSREVARQGGDGVESVDIWRVRYDSRITEDARIDWNSQSWRVASVDILGSKVGMDIRAVRLG